jgi:hypothetical protein
LEWRVVNAARVLARAEAADISFRVKDGAVRMEADTPPPNDLLADLRQHREEVAFLLAIRRALQNPAPMDHDAGEDGAMAAHYAAPASSRGDHADWLRPEGLTGPDRLAGGLLKGFLTHLQR